VINISACSNIYSLLWDFCRPELYLYYTIGRSPFFNLTNPNNKTAHFELVVIVHGFLFHWKEIWNYKLLNPKRSRYKVYCRHCMKHLKLLVGEQGILWARTVRKLEYRSQHSTLSTFFSLSETLFCVGYVTEKRK
jgi:hypothetical protein